jgi:hypothetical protein
MKVNIPMTETDNSVDMSSLEVSDSKNQEAKASTFNRAKGVNVPVNVYVITRIEETDTAR